MRYIQPEARRQEEEKEKTRIKNGQFHYDTEGVDYWITSGANLRGEFPYLRKDKMIEQLKVIQDELRTTEKYLSGIINNEWMRYHPHFMRNDKRELKDIIKNLKKRQSILNTKIQELKGSKQ